MSALEVVTTPTLDELAATINREHELVVAAGESIVHHAILAGEALSEVKARLAWGEWETWLEKHFPKGIDTAYHYLRFAAYKDRVKGASSLNAARAILNGVPYGTVGRPRSEHAETILAMRDAGLKRREIAEKLGVSKYSVDWQLRPPEYRQRALGRSMKANRDRDARNRAAKKALERQERDAAMKKQGGDAWDAYVLVRKLAPLLESLKLNSAYAKCVAIEDELVKAVKTT